MFLYEPSIPANARAAFVAMCGRLGAAPSDIAVCIKIESNFNPAAKAPGSSASGLIQIIEANARKLGTTTADLRQKSFVEQLPYVEGYLRNAMRETGKQPQNVYDWYLLIHYPVAVGKPDNYVLYAAPGDAYNGNKGLDANKDGQVTIAEIKRRVNQQIPAGYVQTALYQPLFWVTIAGLFLAFVIYRKQKTILNYLQNIQKSWLQNRNSSKGN